MRDHHTVTTTPEAPTRGARLPRSARRVQLLSAAQEVFVANGYHSAAMDEIAERAGVSKPVLYQHFPSKLELYIALLDTSIAEVVSRVQEALDSTSDNKQRVAATVEAFFSYVDDPGSSFRLVFENDLTNEPAVRERLDALIVDCARSTAHVIAEDTGLDDDQAMLLAVGLVGSAQVSARYWLQTGSRIPRDAAAALMGTLNWRGIRGFPRREEQPPA